MKRHPDQWWWEKNREKVSIEFELSENKDEVVVHPVFSNSLEHLPEDEYFTIFVEENPYSVFIEDDKIEVASDESFAVAVSKDVAYVFGFVAGLRVPLAVPERIIEHIPALVSAITGDTSKLQKLTEVQKQDLITMLSVMLHKTKPLDKEDEPKPKLQVLLADEEESVSPQNREDSNVRDTEFSFLEEEIQLQMSRCRMDHEATSVEVAQPESKSSAKA